MSGLGEAQAEVLGTLWDRTLSTRELYDEFFERAHDNGPSIWFVDYSVEGMYAVLLRLEKRGYVDRVPARDARGKYRPRWRWRLSPWFANECGVEVGTLSTAPVAFDTEPHRGDPKEADA